MKNKETILNLEELTVSAKNQILVDNISFTLKQGEIISLIGASGSGKSTILRSINRLADYDSGLDVQGKILLHGKDIYRDFSINQLRTHIGLVFQKPCIFPGSINRNVLFGVRHHRHLNKEDATGLVEDVLKKAHLWQEVKDRLHQPAENLSIGQKQRLSFARTLAVDPEVLMLDEPTSNLDPHSTNEIERCLLEMKDSKSIILVTHSLEQGRRVSDRTIFLSATSGVGRVIEEGDTVLLFRKPELEETRKYMSGTAG